MERVYRLVWAWWEESVRSVALVVAVFVGVVVLVLMFQVVQVVQVVQVLFVLATDLGVVVRLLLVPWNVFLCLCGGVDVLGYLLLHWQHCWIWAWSFAAPAGPNLRDIAQKPMRKQLEPWSHRMFHPWSGVLCLS